MNKIDKQIKQYEDELHDRQDRDMLGGTMKDLEEHIRSTASIKQREEWDLTDKAHRLRMLGINVIHIPRLCEREKVTDELAIQLANRWDAQYNSRRESK